MINKRGGDRWKGAGIGGKIMWYAVSIDRFCSVDRFREKSYPYMHAFNIINVYLKVMRSDLEGALYPLLLC
jgi:hypothetical protein